MTLPTNTVTQYSTVGDREDLMDMIYDISPTETPFMNGCGRGTASAVLTEWQTDSLDAAASNIALEGDDPTALTHSPTSRVANYCQISQKTVIVSGTARAIDQAGRADQLAYEVAKRGKEIKRDMEFALTQNQAASAGGVGTGRALASLESWLSTNKTSDGVSASGATTPGAAGSPLIPTTAPTDASTAGTFEQASLDAIIKECWSAGGDPTVIMVGPHNRTVVSNFTGISTLQTDANATQNVTLIGAVDFYKSNFGTLKVVPNRFQRDATAFVLDMDYFSVNYLRPMQLTELAKTGDSEKRQMLVEYTLCVKNEASSGKVTDLLTS
jgi:hypothetical protein